MSMRCLAVPGWSRRDAAVRPLRRLIGASVERTGLTAAFWAARTFVDIAHHRRTMTCFREVIPRHEESGRVSERRGESTCPLHRFSGGSIER